MALVLADPTAITPDSASHVLAQQSFAAAQVAILPRSTPAVAGCRQRTLRGDVTDAEN
jgi:hypothetical protein